jgi:aminoglycoside phosphotransferase family enzyme/predicted kinase
MFDPLNSKPALSRCASNLLSALNWPDSFPEDLANSRVVETHISLVFIGRRYVLKLKKAVCFAFLDATEPSERWRLCCQEVLLNRRFSENIYLGVLPLPLGAKKIDFFNLVSNPEAQNHIPSNCEPAVLMRSIPEENLFDHILESGQVNLQLHIRALAQRLARFHENGIKEAIAEINQVPKETEFSRVQKWVDENFLSIRRNVELLSAGAVRALENAEAFTEEFLKSNLEKFGCRLNKGFIIDGHGDLRAEHVVFENQKVSFIDCLEFNEELRTLDVLSDLAFLLSDLEMRGQCRVAEAVQSSYAERLPEVMDAELLRFYCVYRSMVRAKVEMLRLLQNRELKNKELLDTSKVEWRLALASRYSLRLPCQYIIVMCGRMGVGKSTLSRELSAQLALPLMQSDLLRLDLLPKSPNAGEEAYGKGRYALEERLLVYNRMFIEAEKHLSRGCSLILDASFSTNSLRRKAQELALKFGARCVLVYCVLDSARQSQRLLGRSKTPHEVSEGRKELMAQQSANFEDPKDEPGMPLLEVNTDRLLEEQVPELLEKLQLVLKTECI